MHDYVRHLLLPLAAFALLAFTPVAAASPADVVRDCAKDGSLDGRHSEADQRAALDQIPADLDEYSDCRDIIAAAIGVDPRGAKLVAGTSSAGSPGADRSKSPAARKAAARRAEQARAGGGGGGGGQGDEQGVGPRSVDPTDTGVFKTASTPNGMPLPLVLALAALTLLTLTGTLVVLWRRNPAFADSVRRVASRRFRR